MKQIYDLKVTQIRIFPADELPFRSLHRNTAMSKMSNTFKLKPNPQMYFEISPTVVPNINLNNGEYDYNDRSYLIDYLIIEDRRIIIRMTANSDIVNNFFEELRRLLIDIDIREKKPNYEPLIRVDETQCIAKFDFSFEDILQHTKLSDFPKYLAKKVQSYGSKLEIVPNALRFRLKYLSIPEILRKHDITLIDKDFIIERRDRFPYEEQVYFTYSPTDSTTHLEILKELEKRLLT